MQNWVISLSLGTALLVAWIEFFDKRIKSFVAEWLLVSIAVGAMVWLSYWLIVIALIAVAADFYRKQRKLDREKFWRDIERNTDVCIDFFVAILLAAARYFGRALQAGTRWSSTKISEWRRQPRDTSHGRRWPTVLGLIVSSPIAAIPSVLATATLFLLVSLMSETASGTWPELGEIFAGWLAAATYIMLIGFDQLFRNFLVAVPLLVFLAFLGAVFATRPGVYWRRFVLAAMAVGTFYPATFVVVELFGLQTRPFFN